ncbi:MAG: hypothetical protein IPJ61_03980 [Tessaracoccus sp.]|uniref:hypothetical protein n=1 Tax=Tessaracoccus sp. TaxID=1971211 RepID=UPI001EC92D23|nr:hypothetical protein [Tessaracoccus sp.]MBK7820239.1 hypothetical protein [Tessaracoccus sp.]
MPFAIARATGRVVAMVAGTGGSAVTLVWLATALLGAEPRQLRDLITSPATGATSRPATRLRAILSRRYFEKLLRLPRRYFINRTPLARSSPGCTGRSRQITDFLNMLPTVSSRRWSRWALCLLSR